MEITINGGIVIREFSKGDRLLVEAFFDQMGGETRTFFDRNSGNRKKALEFFEDATNDCKYFLAEFNGEMIGYVFLWDMDTMIPWLGIAVSEAFKGKHLGRKLMEYVINMARTENKGGILLTTHTANIRGQALYERCGFIYMGDHTGGERLYLLRF